MKRYSSLQEIQDDVDKGIKVYWSNIGYYVGKTKNSYIVWCEMNGTSGGILECYKDEIGNFFSKE